jgi:photosystem II stability/assembly factor-like uncharacterized protein
MKTTRILVCLFLSLSCQIAQSEWLQTNGPHGGRILCFAVSGTTLFAGTWGVGVFRSSNNGTSWTQVNSGLTAITVNALMVSGTELFAGTDLGGVFRSSDNGTSWTPANVGIPISYGIYCFAVILDSGRVNLYAGTGVGVFHSTDEGTTWDTVKSTTSAVRALGVVGKDLYMGGLFGVYRSTDRGSSWTEADSGMTNKYASSFATDGTNLFASTFGGGVFRTTNGGTSWTQTGLMYRNLWALTISGTDLFAGDWGGGVSRSTDGGASWSQAGLPSGYVAAFAVPLTVAQPGVKRAWRTRSSCAFQEPVRISMREATVVSLFPRIAEQGGLKRASRTGASGPSQSAGRISLPGLPAGEFSCPQMVEKPGRR